MGVGVSGTPFCIVWANDSMRRLCRNVCGESSGIDSMQGMSWDQFGQPARRGRMWWSAVSLVKDIFCQWKRRVSPGSGCASFYCGEGIGLILRPDPPEGLRGRKNVKGLSEEYNRGVLAIRVHDSSSTGLPGGLSLVPHCTIMVCPQLRERCLHRGHSRMVGISCLRCRLTRNPMGFGARRDRTILKLRGTMPKRTTYGALARRVRNREIRAFKKQTVPDYESCGMPWQYSVSLPACSQAYPRCVRRREFSRFPEPSVRCGLREQSRSGTRFRPLHGMAYRGSRGRSSGLSQKQRTCPASTQSRNSRSERHQSWLRESAVWPFGSVFSTSGTLPPQYSSNSLSSSSSADRRISSSMSRRARKR